MTHQLPAPLGERRASPPPITAQSARRPGHDLALTPVLLPLLSLLPLLTSLLTACGDDAPRCQAVSAEQREQLIEHDLWRLAEPGEDPWRTHRPDDVSCDPTGRQPEDFAGTYSFGIDTALCSYTTLVQETATDVCPGEEVLVWLWRFALTGPEGANAHIAAQIGDEPLFEDIIPIPATSGLKVETYTATRFHPAGTPITFHIRNHGNNTYQLLELSRCLGETCRPD